MPVVLGSGVERAEEEGLVFAFKARVCATLLVAVALVMLTSWPRSLVYLGFAGGFLLFGYVPFRLRRHPQADVIKFVFVLMDVALITAAIINIPTWGAWLDWPPQTRLRSQNFLLLVLLLGEAALTYSAPRVLWTGACIAAIWSSAFAYLYLLPDTVRYADIVAQETDERLLAFFLAPTYVSLPQWLAQLVATGTLTVTLATAVQRSRSHLEAQVRAEVRRSDLARYVSPDLAEALAAGGPDEFGRPATRQVAVLFADIVGFTGLSERLGPERTFALLRSFQQRGAEIVFRHGGTLDKFLGDGLMATFGALRDEADAPARAIACAFDLHDEIARWSAKRRRRGAAPIVVAVGVHYGPVAVGNIGSDRRIEFTAIGDVVNVASRLEQSSRRLGSAIVVSDECVAAAAALPEAAGTFARVEEVSVRGRATPLKVHLAGGDVRLAAAPDTVDGAGRDARPEATP